MSTYHVSRQGNDRNTGTEQKPFLTIQLAANTAAAGDRVRIWII